MLLPLQVVRRNIFFILGLQFHLTFRRKKRNEVDGSRRWNEFTGIEAYKFVDMQF